VPTERIKMTIFVVSGVMAAIAGLILAARFGSTRPDIGSGLELSVITITVLGGISIFGGSGTMIGAILALILIGILRFGMGLVNIQGQVQDVVIGSLLILSILLPRVGSNLNAMRSWSRATWVMIALGIGVAALFGWFYIWSRTLIKV